MQAFNNTALHTLWVILPKYSKTIYFIFNRIRDGETCTAGDIKDFCKGQVRCLALTQKTWIRRLTDQNSINMLLFTFLQIAYYKIPSYIKFVDECPITASGKVILLCSYLFGRLISRLDTPGKQL